MRLVGIAWRGYRVPFRRPYAWARGRPTARYGLLVRLSADAGLEGLGEASPVGPGDPGEVERTAGLLARVGARLLGLRPEDALEALSSLLDPYHPLTGPVRFGLETALYDLLGRARGEPLASLLGGAVRPVPVNGLIPQEDPEEAARSAREAVAEGFAVLKVKVGGKDLARDEDLLEAVRRAAGPEVALRADANGAWTVEEALAALDRFRRFRLEYLEQPLPPGDLEGLLRLRRAGDIPLAADEAVRSPEDARLLLEMGAVSFVVVKAGRMGLRGAAEVVRLAGRAAVITSSLEAGVGLAASLHLAGLLPPGGPASGLATGPLLESDLLRTPLVPRGGVLAVPPGPGLGVALDEEAVERFAFGPAGSLTLGRPRPCP